jgi:hypothetical protein
LLGAGRWALNAEHPAHQRPMPQGYFTLSQHGKHVFPGKIGLCGTVPFAMQHPRRSKFARCSAPGMYCNGAGAAGSASALQLLQNHMSRQDHDRSRRRALSNATSSSMHHAYQCAWARRSSLSHLPSLARIPWLNSRWTAGSYFKPSCRLRYLETHGADYRLQQ